MIACLVWAAVPAPAYASPEDDAERYYEKSGELYYNGDYAGAITELRRAYALVQDPIFLYNISLAQLKLGDLKNSAATADAAEAGGLPEPDRTLNLSRRAAVGSLIGAQQVASDVASRPPEVVVEQAPLPANPATARSPLQTIGVGLGAAGVALTVSGVLIGAANQSLWTNYRLAAAAGDEAEYDRLGQKLRTRQTLGRVLMFAGLPLVAAGAGLWVWGRPTETRVVFLLGPAGIAVRGHFR